METIAEAKDYLRDNFKLGVDCPACGQMVKLYKYKFFGSNADALIKLYRLDQQQPEQIWHHARKFAYGRDGVGRAMHYADMRFWGLIEKQPTNDDPNKKSSGFWRITDKGKRFVLAQIKIESRILVYNNKFQGYPEGYGMVDIWEALGNKFDYRELMGADMPTKPVLQREGSPEHKTAMNLFSD